MPFLTAAPSGPGVASPAAGAATAITDPAAAAKMLAMSGLVPPGFGTTGAGLGAQGAIPGAQYTGGIAGAQDAQAGKAISGAQTGVASVLGDVLKQQPPRTLGALLRGA